MVHCFVGCTRGGIAALRLRAVSTGIKRLKSTVYLGISKALWRVCRCNPWNKGELIVRTFALFNLDNLSLLR